jgi:hypothetical protein
MELYFHPHTSSWRGALLSTGQLYLPISYLTFLVRDRGSHPYSTTGSVATIAGHWNRVSDSVGRIDITSRILCVNSNSWGRRGGVGVELYAFLTFALDASEWPSSLPSSSVFESSVPKHHAIKWCKLGGKCETRPWMTRERACTGSESLSWPGFFFLFLRRRAGFERTPQLVQRY